MIVLFPANTVPMPSGLSPQTLQQVTIDGGGSHVRFYRLDADEHPVIEPDRAAWADWIVDPRSRANLHVAVDYTALTRISTMFIGFEDEAVQPAQPLVWETQVDKGPLDGLRQKYANRAQARLGHERVVARVRDAERDLNGCNPN